MTSQNQLWEYTINRSSNVDDLADEEGTTWVVEFTTNEFLDHDAACEYAEKLNKWELNEEGPVGSFLGDAYCVELENNQKYYTLSTHTFMDSEGHIAGDIVKDQFTLQELGLIEKLDTKISKINVNGAWGDDGNLLIDTRDRSVNYQPTLIKIG